MDKGLETLTLQVKGMDCAQEVALIEKQFKALPGVRSWQPNLITQSLTVSFDTSALTQDTLIKAVEATGMKASLDHVQVPHSSHPWWKERRMVFLATCGILTGLGYALEQLGLPELAVKGLYTAAILVGGYYPAKVGLAAFRTWTLNINTLLVFAAVAAVCIGLWEEAAVLVFIYSLGNALEAYATEKARGSLRALMELVPQRALVRRNEEEMTLSVQEVQCGDLVIVRPGEKIPLDGKVTAGSSAVDQSPITGESIPVAKSTGDEVFAGTINQRGTLEVRVTRLATETTLARIIHTVEEAQARKSSYQRFGERFGKFYTPAMILLAALVAAFPPLFLAQPIFPWVYRGLVLLVVSCSCGLALSVPVAVVAAIANAARYGVLYKGGISLESASRIRAVAFDKTGTLTVGQPVVTDVFTADPASTNEVLAIAASVESRSEHPLADAIVRHARAQGVPLLPVVEFEALPGLGAKAYLDGTQYYVGSQRLFAPHVVIPPQIKEQLLTLEAECKTTVLVGTQECIIGLVSVADQLRREARQTVATLKQAGLHVTMLTGDNEGTARAIAEQAGVNEYKAGLLPEDKVAAIEALREQWGGVAMVGDGVNDAPAMVAAHLGIAMGAAGTDIAIETADIALMSDNLSRLPYVLTLSRRAVTIIKQNIGASLAIVAFLIPAALIGWVGLVPGLLLNELGALLVIFNSLRLFAGTPSLAKVADKEADGFTPLAGGSWEVTASSCCGVPEKVAEPTLSEVARMAIGLVVLDERLDAAARNIGTVLGHRMTQLALDDPLSLPIALDRLRDTCRDANFVQCKVLHQTDDEAQLRLDGCAQVLAWHVPQVGRPICSFDVGFFEGFLQSLTGNAALAVTETACLGQGDPFCEFFIRRNGNVT